LEVERICTFDRKLEKKPPTLRLEAEETKTLESDLRLDTVAPATDLTTIVYSSAVNVDMANLVPMTRLDCRKALLANMITYPEPEYLVAGGPSEYDITRAMITLEDNEIVKLGRNDLTNIKWSAVSRELCDISFKSNIAYVTMKKDKEEHAVYLNGKALNRSVDEKIPLNDSDIISLYGPTGFAYQLKLYSFSQEC